MNDASITVVYDNTSSREDLIADWGFSALIQYNGNTILFDSGAKADILVHNLEVLYGSLEVVENAKIFLSHDHFDHNGGIPFIVRSSANTCFIPASASPQLKQTIIEAGGKPIPIQERLEICPHIWSSGELEGPTNEQALVMDVHGKLVVITGCAHPGIVPIVQQVVSVFKKAPYLVMGGFHWYESSMKEVKSQISQLRTMGVQKVAPCHCTGNKAIAWIRKNWKEGFVEASAGTHISL